MDPLPTACQNTLQNTYVLQNYAFRAGAGGSPNPPYAYVWTLAPPSQDLGPFSQTLQDLGPFSKGVQDLGHWSLALPSA